MADYIDMQVAIDEMTQSVCGDTWEVEKAIEAVRQLPAADVAPVRHARWRHYEGMYVCEDCGAQFNDESPFCPMCGAKMDGKRREDVDEKENNGVEG